ncbi:MULTISPECIES: FtsK/SpoIIIE domain-containing protein [Kitasatospora]|uniref:Putative FtsK/SpoIIIE-like protein n=1 Tax=Kitasatospora setae (strain ATCC 33774 / DSM 43861 / JCM 3304 / KCC A-0304 / NBRC 14216 / KM-6054) TaxID=452652 RepID=E4N6Z6_KITSK|nr:MULTISPECIES: FtsK/SpoIIIE domain-containing protein [Kitasatospora]BAJ26977.1 putative FtsK/SpoIIIE-like protein [Kitasatospora setae KM-6054]
MSLTRHFSRGREMARSAGDHAADVFAPLTLIGRGLRSHADWAKARWAATPKERRGPTLLVGAAVVLGVFLLPHGPLLAIVALLASAAWVGRRPKTPAEPAPDPADTKLPALYAALTPYFGGFDDPGAPYRPEGDWKAAFGDWEFDQDGRLAALEIGYPAYFTDTEPSARARIEQVVQGKAGRSREYRFDWDEESNRLRVTALAPLPADIAAQRFVTAPGEIVLGFTDGEGSRRTIPVEQGGVTEQQPPVVWRVGPRSAEPHLLALGAPGHGTSTLLRSIALQALPHGDLVVVDGASTGEHACLVNRPGVHTVETSLHGALAALEWCAQETERRLVALNAARHHGLAAPADVTRPLWILLDRVTELSELAHAEGRTDPQELLEVPLRHGRAARVTVVFADGLDALGRISPTVRTCARARVVLGPVNAESGPAALGGPLDIAPAAHTPPGRGYARIGTTGPVRLQVPVTVDPLDEDAPEQLRDAVAALLPHRAPRTAAPAEAPVSASLAGEPAGATRIGDASPVPPVPPLPPAQAPAGPADLTKEALPEAAPVRSRPVW